MLAIKACRAEESIELEMLRLVDRIVDVVFHVIVASCKRALYAKLMRIGAMIFSYVVMLSHVWIAGKNRNEPAYGADFRSWHAQRIIALLMNDYNKSLRPRGHNGDMAAPTIVSTSLNIKSISTVKEQNMEFKAQFRFKQEWYDGRLKFDDWYFKPTDYLLMGRDYDQIWLPDTFFQNEKEASRHMIDRENYYIKFRSDGKVVYDRRLSMTFSCIMDLSKYPMDTQTCLIDFASYAYTTNDIVYEWRNDEPLRFGKSVTSALPNFVITGHGNGSCSSVTNTGDYSCLRVELQLQRVFSFFLLQLYVPSAMLVAVSWVSYWIDWRATAGRVPLAIITLLTMITQSHVINATLPPVSYTKAIDVWIGACVAFIFCALIEYAIVNYTGIQEQRRKSSRPMRQQSNDSEVAQWFGCFFWLKKNGRNHRRTAVADGTDGSSEALLRTHNVHKRHKLGGGPKKPEVFEATASLLNDQTQGHSALTAEAGFNNMVVHFEDISNSVGWIRRKAKYRSRLANILTSFHKHGRAERIDVISRTIFPIAFLLFNIVYWVMYW